MSIDHQRRLGVLLVEDSPGDALITAEAFDEAGLLVDLTVADNGPEALRFLADATSISDRRLPELIVLDINLPGMSGLDVLDEIRRHRVLARIPVLVLTGSSAPADMWASYRGHAFRFLSKPVEVDQLLEAVRALESHWLPAIAGPRALTALNVLLVEDNDGDALMIEELLADAAPPPFDPIVLHRARSRAEMLRLLHAPDRPDCVLVDLGLPDAHGVDAVVDAIDAAPHVAIVVMTGSNDPDLARATLAAGAQDHLVKGAALTEEVTRRSIRYAIDRAAQVGALRASRQELSEFAQRVAHDLKSPMSVLVSLLAVLRQGGGSDDVALHALATRTSTRLIDMVDRLLEYAETAGSEESLGTVALPDVIAWVSATLESDLAGATLRIEGELPVVHANEIGLRHVFLNLVSNSLKYARPSIPAEIVVRGRREGDLVLVDVVDNGRGIDSEYRQRVFGAGFRVLVDRPGTGVGLATVLRIMQLVGGQVAADARADGVGTAMHLQFRSGAGPDV